jgi:Tfp pilus assembly protein PilF
MSYDDHSTFLLIYQKVIVSMLKKFSFALLITLLCSIGAAAQEVEVNRYNINARVDTAASAIEVRASLEIANVSQTPKSKLYFLLTKLAKVNTVTVGGAAAQFETVEDRRAPVLNQFTITPQAALAAGGKATLEVSYRIEAPESSGLVAVSATEVLLVPESVWVPMASTGFLLTGASTAPFSLTVTGSTLRAASAGNFKGDATTQTFEQPLNSLPFFVASTFDQPVSAERGGVKIEVYAQTGLQSADGKSTTKDNINRLVEEAGKAVDFLSKTLGAPPQGAGFRIISSSRASNIAVPGALVLSEQTLRRDVLSTNTIEAIVDALARIWTDGRVRIRGQVGRAPQPDRPAQLPLSYALLRDSLPRYLAALYFEERFGKDAGREAFNRMRWVYAPIMQARRDAELDVQTLLLPTFTAATLAKGPLVLRLFAETMGRDKFITALRSLFTGEQTKIVTSNDLRLALIKEGTPGLEKLFQQWVDTIIEPDIVIGVPQASDKPNAQSVNIRNLGTGDVAVAVIATTVSGKQLTSTVTVPSENITSFDIATAEKITAIEVDPEKLIIQSRYDNDTKPVQEAALNLFNDSLTAFNKGEYPAAETKLREAARINPQNATIHAWLARTLAAQNKNDEAVRAANAALAITPAPAGAIAWAHITLGQIALAKNQASEASGYLRRAVVEADDAPGQYASREAAVKAERAANPSASGDESVRTFISQLDTLIKQPSSDKLYTIVLKSNLKKFVQGLTLTPPTAWTTEIERAEQIDANRLSLDVKIKAVSGGRDQAGTAVLILYKTSSGWLLEEVQLFNVK